MDEQAANVLKHIADKLDVPVQALWAGLVAYAPFAYYQWLAMAVALGIGALVSLSVFAWSLPKSFKQEIPYAPITVISGFCAFVFLVFFFGRGISDMGDALAAKNAPEAWASKYILRRFGR